VPLGLLAVGAAHRSGGVAGGRRRNAAPLGVVKLVAVPADALGLGMLLGVDGDQRAVLLAFAAVPPATSSYVLASRMGGDGPFVATLTSLATAAALITLPVWLTVAGAGG
jgi:predicted permease